MGSSCARVDIKDAEVCLDGGKYGTRCFHMFSDEKRELTSQAWDQERFGMFCTNSDNFANWKAAILKLCGETKLCTYEIRQLVLEFAERADKTQASLKGQQLPIYDPRNGKK